MLLRIYQAYTYATASENFLCSNRENIHALPKFKWVFADVFLVLRLEFSQGGVF